MKKFLVLLSLVFSAITLHAQDAFERFQFEPDLNYNADITSPVDLANPPRVLSSWRVLSIKLMSLFTNFILVPNLRLGTPA